MGRSAERKRTAGPSEMTQGSINITQLATRLADRSAPRTEADVQSDVRDMLLYSGLNLRDHQVRLEAHAGDRRRIDVEVGRTVFEVKRNLRAGNTLDDARRQLAVYVRQRSEVLGERYVGVITDGASWHLLHPDANGDLREVSSFRLESDRPNIEGLRVWLDGTLATEDALQPTPGEIARRLGAGSAGHALDRHTIALLYEQSCDLPAVRLKRELWARLLASAFGTKFEDTDELFLEHTYLVLVAELVAHAVVGFNIEDPSLTGRALVSGELFATAEIWGVVERDFFDWVTDARDGERFIRSLARRLARFDWAGVEHDVLKILYESVIDAGTRHDLGEYYTPDWLASIMIQESITDPMRERVLDPACGSGTFLFHAVRRYLDEADRIGLSNLEAVTGVCQQVFGVDLHPVAVTLARVTYLLAIGAERLKADRAPLAIPVFLGDSLQWQTEDNLLAAGGVTVYATDGAELFARELHFPSRVLGDVSRFDHLVEELASKASSRTPGSPVPSLKQTFARFAVHPEDQPALEATFVSLCRLYDEGRNHIWGYYVRNLARPYWLSLEGNRVDVLIGNPPWLSYRFMTLEMQRRFKERSIERGLWVGAQLTTHQDLSSFFVARAAELYLKKGGRLSFVMPVGVLTRQHYRGFRTGQWTSNTRQVNVAFREPWDMSGIEVSPALFPIPCCVVSGDLGDVSGPLPDTMVEWSGSLPARDIDWPLAVTNISRKSDVPVPNMEKAVSPYRERFTQGAFIWPRVLLLVEEEKRGPLGTSSGRMPVRSARSKLEKKPWRELPSLTGSVESQFVRPICLGASLGPFRVIRPERAIIPWDSLQLICEDAEEMDRFPGLRAWWDAAQQAWEEHRPDYTTDDLCHRIEYKAGTSKQFPIAPHRVVYTASGSNLVAARLTDRRAIVSESLYWAACASDEEARYLTTILNSEALLARIRNLQAEGQFGRRHFHKVVFAVGFPLFDSTDELHRAIAKLGQRAESIAESLDLADAGFRKARRVITGALGESGAMEEIELSVSELLGRRSGRLASA